MYVGSWYCGKWGKFNGENKWFKDGPPAQHPLHMDLSKVEEEKKTKTRPGCFCAKDCLGSDEMYP